MSGIAKAVADVLRADTISTDPSYYVNNFPHLYKCIEDVPPFFYTSLKDIWSTGIDRSIPFENMITHQFGYGDTGVRGIDICPVRILDSVDGPEGFPASNEIGARFAEIYILFRIGGTLKKVEDANRITQAELRIQRLLDYQYRTNILGFGEISVSATDGLNPDSDLKLYWQGFKSGPINDKEIYACYFASYTELRL